MGVAIASEFRLPTVEGIVDRRRMLPARARGLRVVHLGCVDEWLTEQRAGTGSLLHEELARTSAELLGVDISERGLEVLAQLVPGKYLLGDVEHLGDLDLPPSDLVIAAEIIEHLGSPGLFLTGLAAYLRTYGAKALITTPNSYSWKQWVPFAFRRREVTHPDHRSVYSPTTLLTSLRVAGLQADALYMHAWPPGPGLQGSIVGGMDRMILRGNPLLAVGFVVEVSVPVST